MKKTIVILIVVLLTGNLRPLKAQQAGAFASIDSNAIMIGDHLNMEIGIGVPEGFDILWPQLADTLSKHIEILSKENIDTITENDQIVLRQRLKITSFDSGFFEIPSVVFHFRRPGDTALFPANTNKLFLQVYTPVVDTAQDFKVIKGPVSEPYTLKEVLPWVLLGIVVIAAIVLLIWYLRKRSKNQPVFRPRSRPLAPPHVIAIEKLEELRLARIWQQGRLKLYYTQLTDIVREYLERRYGFDAPEMTTEEILEALRHQKVNSEVTNKLKSSLELADLVKFAKARPTALENDLSLDHCVDFVNETKVVPVAEDNPKRNVEPQMGEGK